MIVGIGLAHHSVKLSVPIETCGAKLERNLTSETKEAITLHGAPMVSFISLYPFHTLAIHNNIPLGFFITPAKSAFRDDEGLVIVFFLMV